LTLLPQTFLHFFFYPACHFAVIKPQGSFYFFIQLLLDEGITELSSTEVGTDNGDECQSKRRPECAGTA
jgi:hypothetical protein